jgi:DNA-binding transcriptional ArsR family regulator
MDLDRVFHALSDATRRRLLDELAERDGQTLFELHVRLIAWQQVQPGLSRQGLSRHLSVLEKAGLLRAEWRWRSKHHFLVRDPIRTAWKIWLKPFTEAQSAIGENAHEDCSDECSGR